MKSAFRFGSLSLMVRTALFLVATILPLLGHAADGVKGKHVYRVDQSETVFQSMNQACVSFLQRSFPGKSLLKAKDYGPNGNFECYWREADGSENNSWGGAHEISCPANAALEDAAAPLECKCLSGYQASAGQCVSQTAAPPRGKEDLLATPQRRDEEGCGLNKEQQQAITSILGQNFNDVPYLKAAWVAAISPGFPDAVAKLKANPKTNSGNRTKYFAPTRDRFWNNLAKDPEAKKMFAKAKIEFPPVGRAARIEIDGKWQQIDVDHIIGLAEDPKLMITVSNLQLSPQRENRQMLEKIARNDAFYDPKAWMPQRLAAANSCSAGGKGKK